MRQIILLLVVGIIFIGCEDSTEVGPKKPNKFAISYSKVFLDQEETNYRTSTISVSADYEITFTEHYSLPYLLIGEKVASLSKNDYEKIKEICEEEKVYLLETKMFTAGFDDALFDTSRTLKLMELKEDLKILNYGERLESEEFPEGVKKVIFQLERLKSNYLK